MRLFRHPIHDAVAGVKRLPLLAGIRPYKRSELMPNVLAGATLAALAIPEVMGYTTIAGMPVVTGLYTILIPIAVFALLGSSRHLVVGADSATAAILYAGIAALGLKGVTPDSPAWVGYAGVTALLCAAFLIIARLLGLGFIANFLSKTVLIGFLTGVGVQISLEQFGGMLGVPNGSGGPVKQFAGAMQNLSDTNSWTLAVSLFVIGAILGFARFLPKVPGGLVAVIGAIWAGWALDLGAKGVALLGPVPGGLPSVQLPQNVVWSDAGPLVGTALSIMLVIIAQSAATSQAYAYRYGEAFDEDADLVGLGTANIAAGLTGTFVVNGSPTKTEMVDEAGSTSELAQLTTAVVTMIVLLFLTAPLQYLPKAVLSAVVFVVGVKLIDVTHLRRIWSLRRDEFAVALATAATVVFVGVEAGILLAILLSILAQTVRNYRPMDIVMRHDAAGELELAPPVPGTVTEPGLVIYRFGAGLFFANSSRFVEELLGLAPAGGDVKDVILAAAMMDDVDYTGATAIKEVVNGFKERGVRFSVARLDPNVYEQLRAYGLVELIGEDRFFASVGAAVRATVGDGSMHEVEWH